MVRSADCVSADGHVTKSVKPEKSRRLGTHRARHVVDPKGKVCVARTFIHNSKIASAGKSQVKKGAFEAFRCQSFSGKGNGVLPLR